MTKFEKLTWLFISSIPVLIIIALFFVPTIVAIVLSFIYENSLSIRNYLIAIQLYTKDLTFTLFASVVGSFMTVLISILAASFLYFYKNKIIEWIVKLPLFVPVVVVGHAFRILFAPHGLLNLYLAKLRIVDIANPPDYINNLFGLAIALTWKHIGFTFLLIFGAFKGVENSLIESAINFGTSKMRIVTDFLMPLTKKHISVSIVLTFTSMLGAFSIPLLLSGQTARTIMVDIYYNIIYVRDLGVANALGVISFILSSGAAIYYIMAVKNNEVSYKK